MRIGFMRNAIVSTGVAKSVLPANPFRRAIILCAAHDENACFSTDQNVVSGAGITIPNKDRPYTLTIEQHGDLVQRAWYVIGAGGADRTVSVFEIIEVPDGRNDT